MNTVSKYTVRSILFQGCENQIFKLLVLKKNENICATSQPYKHFKLHHITISYHPHYEMLL